MPPYERPSYMQLTSALPQLLESCSTKLHELKIALASSANAPTFFRSSVLRSIENSEVMLAMRCNQGRISDAALERGMYRVAADQARLERSRHPVPSELTFVVNSKLECFRNLCVTSRARDQLQRMLDPTSRNLRAERDVRDTYPSERLQSVTQIRSAIFNIDKEARSPQDAGEDHATRFNAIVGRLGFTDEMASALMLKAADGRLSGEQPAVHKQAQALLDKMAAGIRRTDSPDMLVMWHRVTCESLCQLGIGSAEAARLIHARLDDRSASV